MHLHTGVRMRWEPAFLKVPFPRKASKRPLVFPSQKVASFISNSPMYIHTEWEAVFVERPHIPKKGFQNAPGSPKPKSDQFCVSATHKHIGKALFSRAPNPEKRPPKGSWLVAPSQKVARVISQAQDRLVLSRSAPLGLFGPLWAPLGLSQPASQPPS